ncbi:FAD binding domain-containing protein [Falsiroseomonas tokyonensis]|uniref:FAD binding domain-containing protein n=1 Tax=Falsiroseomonas tokyonensis TaxID=430521 RepID=A0ABV7BYT2_9PROT|nr:FAD binding domain-containing protein [Falsiroseomonas tokyonensis]MBU8539611.1 FAD binding domain-containing protein [Falsiroseomonas tokyonensis]
MKPAPFAWHAPEDLAAALALKAQHGGEAQFLAGGQSLVPAMNFRVAQPAVLVDLNRVAALDSLAFDAEGTLRVGAMCRYRRIERDAEVARRLPLLVEALAEVAHPQIRNRGTLAGNLCHADPASEMPAVMLALEARFRLCRHDGERVLPARDFFLGPLATALAEEEMLAEIQIPALPPGTGTGFLEVARRRGDYAMMGVAAVLRRGPEGRCVAARLALCSAGPTPMLAERAAASLVGTRLTAEDFAAAAALAVAEIDPMGSVQASPAYQRHLAGVLVPRALALAAERAA